ncbi:histidine kinase [Streptomyces sp. NPDC047821]|uniref:histidine kinase n=1 Tax=Streptomyces sp. NPDC047821 TaxID=3365488 RepID=UPI003719C73C
MHDGTQARLVALAITLSLAEDALSPATGPELGRLRTLVDRACGQTEDTTTELRRLTRGIHPVALDGGPGGRPAGADRPPRRLRSPCAWTCRSAPPPGSGTGRLLLRRRSPHQCRRAQRRPRG